LSVSGAAAFTAPPTMSGANIAAGTIPNGALVSTPVTAITSADGSVSVTGTAPSLNLAVAPIVAGVPGNAAFKAGIAYYRKRFNIGTQTATVEPTTDNSFTPAGAFLGATTLQTTSPGAAGSTIEAVYLIKVKPGSGPLAIGGYFITNAPHTAVIRDGVNAANFGASVLTQTWNTTIPDDGASHALVFHHDTSSTTATIVGDWSSWLPTDATGGIDGTKIASISPGSQLPARHSMRRKWMSLFGP